MIQIKKINPKQCRMQGDKTLEKNLTFASVKNHPLTNGNPVYTK